MMQFIPLAHKWEASVAVIIKEKVCALVYMLTVHFFQKLERIRDVDPIKPYDRDRARVDEPG